MSQDRSVHYAGYVIEPEPQFLTDFGKWNIAYSISKDTGAQVTSRRYEGGERDLYDSEAEATAHSVHAAKQRIDAGIDL